jgi:octaprenyl-diphosphate synthase
MSGLTKIKSPVAAEMDDFEVYFSRTMRSEIPLLKIILNYVLRRKGKQMRPMLIFLTAKLNGTIKESTFVAATLIELVHTTSLVHDDVVDDANERRGFLSINSLWNSKIAVLLGDYLLSKGLQICVEKKSFDMLQILSEAVQSMSEGELLQLQKARKLDIKEDDYFTIIRMKTAALIAACTASGAKSVTDDMEIVKKMKEFGENIGIAFQIKDDILDYGGDSFTGKVLGNDIKEKKITLPLIHALGQVTYATRQNILRIIRNKKKSRAEIQQVIDFVAENGGMEYSEGKMHLYRDKALAILDTYPDSDIKNSLQEFVMFTTSRNK